MLLFLFLPICVIAVQYSTTAVNIVLGQPSFENFAPGASLSQFSGPYRSLKSTVGLFVADTNNNRVLLFTNVTNNATASVIYGQTAGLGSADLKSPKGVCTDGKGNVYIADSGNNRVLFYSGTSTIASRVYGQAGFGLGSPNRALAKPGDNTLNNPVDVQANGNNLYVVDKGNHRVVVFDISGPFNGKAVNLYGQDKYDKSISGTGPSSFTNPSGVAIKGANGGIYISDFSNNRIMYFKEKNSKTADFIFNSALTPGVSTTALNQVGGIWSIPQGLFACDSGNNRLVFIRHDSSTACLVWGQNNSFFTSSPAVGANGLHTPTGVSADSSGLYITDFANNRVVMYEPLSAVTLNGLPTDNPLISGSITLTNNSVTTFDLSKDSKVVNVDGDLIIDGVLMINVGNSDAPSVVINAVSLSGMFDVIAVNSTDSCKQVSAGTTYTATSVVVSIQYLNVCQSSLSNDTTLIVAVVCGVCGALIAGAAVALLVVFLSKRRRAKMAAMKRKEFQSMQQDQLELQVKELQRTPSSLV